MFYETSLSGVKQRGLLRDSPFFFIFGAMKVYTINETTNLRDNNWVNNGFFINNIYLRVYGKNRYLGKLIAIVDDYWLAEDAKRGGVTNVSDKLAGITKDPIVKMSAQQVADSINKISTSHVTGRKYYKWYLVELGDGLGGFSQFKRKYVRADVAKLVR